MPHQRCRRQVSPHGGVMRSENTNKCLGALGRLPGGGNITQAAQPTMVLTSTACRDSRSPAGAKTGALTGSEGYCAPACWILQPFPAAQRGLGGECSEHRAGGCGVWPAGRGSRQHWVGKGMERLIFLMVKVLTDTVCGASSGPGLRYESHY